MVTRAVAERRRAQGRPRLTEKEQEAHRQDSKRRARIILAERVKIHNEEKLRRGCADCGYADHPEALEWDHIPGFEKVGEIGVMVRQIRTNWTKVLAEMEKCEVVCANCHRIRTAERRQANE